MGERSDDPMTLWVGSWQPSRAGAGEKARDETPKGTGGPAVDQADLLLASAGILPGFSGELF